MRIGDAVEPGTQQQGQQWQGQRQGFHAVATLRKRSEGGGALGDAFEDQLGALLQEIVTSDFGLLARGLPLRKLTRAAAGIHAVILAEDFFFLIGRFDSTDQYHFSRNLLVHGAPVFV